MPASPLVEGSQYSNRQALVLPVLLSKWSLVTQPGWGLQHSRHSPLHGPVLGEQQSWGRSRGQKEQCVFLGTGWCGGFEPEVF